LENITEILEETEQVSEDDELYEQDVRDIVYVLEKTKEKTKTQNDRQNFIRSSSNIVSQNKRDVWENIPVRSHVIFLIYINDIENCSEIISFVMYADDTNAFILIKIRNH
jgi:hypothetical protein